MSIATSLTADDLRMLIRGYADALAAHRETINRLNVYPVPDGDTGTNMALTLASVACRCTTPRAQWCWKRRDFHVNFHLA